MKQIKLLGLSSLCLISVACSDIEDTKEIAQMTPTEVALFACNAFKNKELEQLQPLVPKKSYDRLIRKSTKNPEELASFIKSVDCTVTQAESITKKKVDMTRVSFEAFAAIKVFKIEGKYQILMEG